MTTEKQPTSGIKVMTDEEYKERGFRVCKGCKQHRVPPSYPSYARYCGDCFRTVPMTRRPRHA